MDDSHDTSGEVEDRDRRVADLKLFFSKIFNGGSRLPDLVREWGRPVALGGVAAFFVGGMAGAVRQVNTWRLSHPEITFASPLHAHRQQNYQAIMGFGRQGALSALRFGTIIGLYMGVQLALRETRARRDALNYVGAGVATTLVAAGMGGTQGLPRALAAGVLVSGVAGLLLGTLDGALEGQREQQRIERRRMDQERAVREDAAHETLSLLSEVLSTQLDVYSQVLVLDRPTRSARAPKTEESAKEHSSESD